MPEFNTLAAPPIDLIVGLGNPGDRYKHTRHNIGFMAIDYLASHWQIQLTTDRKFQGIYGDGRYPSGQRVRLLKPTTYMNLSGQSVRSLCDWFKIEPQSVLVIYDEMDLPFGKIRLRPSGSAGGHNGMKSIISHLGTPNFPRLRVGIGRSTHAVPTAISHVLGSFNPEETHALPDILRLVEDTVKTLSAEGIEKTMSIYNSRTITISAGIV
ncbi:aminoacyl-tRNA hydrolase [Pseudanabaena sp. PCC 6802]|uniref:aminoacyl-tRNA hydrolase n=1 Tax=Pseudanabaena sp. PCC 6802 TaxID=118173 RepID=UPI0003489A49|nr:aminoacyl-tRNA hydrolase [Pseudanabaena sp. PCC 6802]